MTKTRTGKLSDLTPDDRNANQGTERGGEFLEHSLREWGAGRSVLADKHGRLIAGNKTVERAAAIGMDDVLIVPTDGSKLVVVQRTDLDLDDPRTRAFAVADNRAGELSLAWSPEALKALQAEGVHPPGFTDKELAAVLIRSLEPLAEGLTDPDAVPEEARATAIQRGDLFELGHHLLLCGDCTKREDVTRLMRADKAGVCFTSPPYMDAREYGGDVDLSVEHLAMFLPAAAPFVEVFCANLGVMRRDGAVVPYWNAYIDAAQAAGLKLLSWNVWSREGGPMSVGAQMAMFPIQHEFIFVFGAAPVRLIPTVPNPTAGRHQIGRKRHTDGTMVPSGTGGGAGYVTRDARELGTVVTMMPATATKAGGDHPAQFPVALAVEYLQAFTGDVYEPFNGSGTVIIAGEQLARRVRALEIEPRYCQLTIDRWEAFTGRKAVKVGEALPA